MHISKLLCRFIQPQAPLPSDMLVSPPITVTQQNCIISKHWLPGTKHLDITTSFIGRLLVLSQYHQIRILKTPNKKKKTNKVMTLKQSQVPSYHAHSPISLQRTERRTRLLYCHWLVSMRVRWAGRAEQVCNDQEMEEGRGSCAQPEKPKWVAAEGGSTEKQKQTRGRFPAVLEFL